MQAGLTLTGRNAVPKGARAPRIALLGSVAAVALWLLGGAHPALARTASGAAAGTRAGQKAPGRPGSPPPVARLTVTVPRNARISGHSRSRPYAITVVGTVSGRARLSVFLDYDGCRSILSAERVGRAPGVGYVVAGRFTRRSTWASGVRRVDHACAYLTDMSTGVLLATRFVAFRVS